MDLVESGEFEKAVSIGGGGGCITLNLLLAKVSAFIKEIVQPLAKEFRPQIIVRNGD